MRTRQSRVAAEAPPALPEGVAGKSGRGYGALVRWFHLERELWWLALVGWRKPAPSHEDGVFTHHRQANWNLVAGVLSGLIVIEGMVVHLWLQGAGYTVAMWFALGVHVYLLAWVMGDGQALRLYTTRIEAQSVRALRVESRRIESPQVVTLRVGLRGSADIPVARIAACATGSWDEAEPNGEIVSVSGFANLSLTFDSPIEFVPMLGKLRLITSLRVQIDEPERFIRALGKPPA